MATDAELEAVVIDAIRRKLDMPELTKEQALQHTVARSLFDGFLFGRAEPAASDGLAAKSKNTDRSPRTLVGTRVGLRAALEDTFDVGQIQATETERELLVEESDLVTIGGQRRLRLRNDLRAAVLSDAIGSESYDRLLANEVTDDVRNFEAISADPVRLPSAWMRSFLAGQFGGLDGAPLTELRAALDARERIARGRAAADESAVGHRSAASGGSRRASRALANSNGRARRLAGKPAPRPLHRTRGGAPSVARVRR